MKEQITLTIDPEVLEKLREMSKAKSQSLSWMINQALRAFLGLPSYLSWEKEEWYNG